MEKLILASGSPRRTQLLAEAGVTHEVKASNYEEVNPPGLSPADTALEHARGKARDVAAGNPGRWVLGADTLVAFDGILYGKPRTPSLAYAHLSDLSGQTHEVATALCLIAPDGRERTAVDTTRVTFAPMTHEEILAYCATEEPMDKAGAYGAQGIGGFFIEKVEGSFSNVMGLPMRALYALMKDAGLDPLPAG